MDDTSVREHAPRKYVCDAFSESTRLRRTVINKKLQSRPHSTLTTSNLLLRRMFVMFRFGTGGRENMLAVGRTCYMRRMSQRRARELATNDMCKHEMTFYTDATDDLTWNTPLAGLTRVLLVRIQILMTICSLLIRTFEQKNGRSFVVVFLCIAAPP